MTAVENMFTAVLPGQLVVISRACIHNLFLFPSCKRLLHQLKIQNTFSGKYEPVTIKSTSVLFSVDQPESRVSALAYCCGPTVYDNSHIGHAFSYIKFDLVRRFLSEYANVDLITAMNITDIDDKIIERAKKESYTSSHELASRYLKSFLQDLSNLNISPPHVLLQVSKHISCIIEFIQHLEQTGVAYVNPITGDVLADSSTFPPFHINTQTGVSDSYIDLAKSKGKRLPSDFVLWKRAKTGEPSWVYPSPVTREEIAGRPGWHVECSSLVNSTFGSCIDFHFGGKDLIFPHHYNESVACNLYHHQKKLSFTSKSDVASWCKYWLHFGHVTMKGEKMSKSLGNSWYIKDFLNDHSANLLRIICLKIHYRSDLDFDEDLIKKAQEIDRKLNDLVYELQLMIDDSITNGSKTVNESYALTSLLSKVTTDITEGLANDLDFHQGLEAIESLYVYIKQVKCGQRAKISIVDLVKCKFILEKWIRASGLSYNLQPTYTFNAQGINDEVRQKEFSLLSKLQDVRSQLRALANQQKKQHGSTELFSICDELRDWMNKEGFPVSDKSIK